VPTSGGRCRSPRRRAFVRQHCSCWPAGEYMDPWPVYPGARRIDRRRTWRQPGRSAFSGHAHPRRGREQSCRAAVRARVRARPRIFPVPSPHRTVSYAYRIAWGRFVSARSRRKGTARMRARNRVPFPPGPSSLANGYSRYTHRRWLRPGGPQFYITYYT
jgi:hypothetical protein